MFSQTLTAALFALPLVSGAIIDVFVGGANTTFQFTPDQITANVGDSVRFTFGVKNHTVTQSSFASPCTPLAGGFFSGFMPVAATQTGDLPQFQIPITDTKPIWGFCSQTGHCSEHGMVFSVNAPAPPAANSFQAFQAAATAGAATATTSTAAAASTATGSSDAAYGYGASGYGATTGTTTAGAESAAATGAVTSNSTSTGPVTHTVVVGGSAGLVFTPNVVQAAPGDTVQFQFQVKNHTATQSTFAAPCTEKAGGFSSGFMPVATTATTFPTWNLLVNDTTPIWVFCEQTGHCSADGMVMAINSIETGPNNLAAFKAAALASGNATASSSSSNSSTSTASSSAYPSTPASSGAVGAMDGRFSLLTLVMVALGFVFVL